MVCAKTVFLFQNLRVVSNTLTWRHNGAVHADARKSGTRR
jgi:hypothetical protein